MCAFVTAVVADDNNDIPEWKRGMLLRKQQANMARIQEEEAKRKLEETKWEGVPDWKRRLLEAKDEKRAKEMEPELQKLKEEAEKQTKLASMPEWKRNLLIKKQ